MTRAQAEAEAKQRWGERVHLELDFDDESAHCRHLICVAGKVIGESIGPGDHWADALADATRRTPPHPDARSPR